jgi:hypothetical protein
MPIEKRRPHLRNASPEVQRTWRVDSIVPILGEIVGAIKQLYEIVVRRFRQSLRAF